MAGRKILITGFPGFIARRLTREILAQLPDAELTFLVLQGFAGQARRELEALAATPEGRRARFDVVTGDITLSRLGLLEDDYDALRARITDVLHLAAIYDLHVSAQAARAVNVGGTHQVLQFCRDAQHLRRLLYFSTCFVAGRRTGRILEDELIGGAGFKNHYESTKFEAEQNVRAGMDCVPTVIVRPGITVGDSQSGETQKFDGPYFGMVLIDKLRLLQLPLPYLGDSAAEINVVPVDFVARAAVALWLAEGTAGKCYALADPQPVTARTMYAELVRLLGARGPWGQVPPALVDLPLRLLAVRRLLGVPREVLDYFNHDARFDTRNASAALEGTGVTCPHVLDYLPVLVRFYQANRSRAEYQWKPF